MNIINKYVKNQESLKNSAQRRAYDIHYVFSPGQPIKVNPHLLPTSFYGEAFPKAQICPLFFCFDRRHNLDAEAMDNFTGTSEFTLKDYPIPPLIQAVEMMTAYSDKGLIILDSLTGKEPNVVAEAENLLIPDSTATLIAIEKHLQYEAPYTINSSNFSQAMKDTLEQTRQEMLAAIRMSKQFQGDCIAAFEGEVLACQNTGFGRTKADPNERLYYYNLERDIPAEIDAATLREQKKSVMQNESLLANTLAKLSEHIMREEKEKTESAEMVAMKEQMAQQQAMINQLLEAMKANQSESIAGTGEAKAFGKATFEIGDLTEKDEPHNETAKGKAKAKKG